MSWQQLLDIKRRNEEEVADEQTRSPVACPNDGTPLQDGPNGELFCPFDGWRYDR